MSGPVQSKSASTLKALPPAKDTPPANQKALPPAKSAPAGQTPAAAPQPTAHPAQTGQRAKTKEGPSGGFTPNLRGGTQGISRERNRVNGGQEIKTTRSRSNQSAGVQRTDTRFAPTQTGSTKTPAPRQKVTSQVGGHERTQGNTKKAGDPEGQLVLADQRLGNRLGAKDGNLATGSKKLAPNTSIAGQVTGPYSEAKFGAKAGLNKDGIYADVSLKLDAQLIKAGGEINQTIPVQVGNDTVRVHIKGKLEGNIGADGELKLRFNISPTRPPSLEVGGSGFAGAKAKLSGTVGLSVNHKLVTEGELSGTLGAGVGGEASAKVDLLHGNVSLKAYGAAGVGVGVGFEGKVYYGNTLRALNDLRQ